jgi:hypothetical protein
MWSINNVNKTTDSTVMIRSEDGFKTTSSIISLPINKDENLSEIVCRVLHPALQEVLVAKVTFNVLYPPQIVTHMTSDNTISEGESVTLTCDVESNPPASITWTKLGIGETFISSESILSLPVISWKDTGTYQCQGENSLGLSNPSTQILDVQCKD